MIISEKTSYQLINKASANNEDGNTTLDLFLESLGQDFLTRISQDNNPQRVVSSREELNVKQEVFESIQQVQVYWKYC